VKRRTADDLLRQARDGVPRLTPREALAAARDGAVLVDVRSRDEQERQGALLPGAVHHPLSVVLWRLDPDVPTHNPKLPLDARLIVVCREGYSSSLAAQQLRELGFEHATDLVGGVEAWVAAGLPVVSVERTREVERFLAHATGWAQARDVAAAGLAGSWARGDAVQESDVDLIVLAERPAAFTESEGWVGELGATGVVRRRDWGAITERRLALPSGLEVEVGIGEPGWASVEPLDPGTTHVVRDGFRALHDPHGLLARLVDAVARES
jgi:rhodanese-related sulfurtransferase